MRQTLAYKFVNYFKVLFKGFCRDSESTVLVKVISASCSRRESVLGGEFILKKFVTFMLKLRILRETFTGFRWLKASRAIVKDRKRLEKYFDERIFFAWLRLRWRGRSDIWSLWVCSKNFTKLLLAKEGEWKPFSDDVLLSEIFSDLTSAQAPIYLNFKFLFFIIKSKKHRSARCAIKTVNNILCL